MKIAIFGAKGRVGSVAADIAEGRGHAVIRIDKGTPLEGVTADVVVDFSAAEATGEVCALCERCGAPLVTGVTGRNALQQEQIEALSRRVRVVAKPNFSKGVQALLALVKAAAEALPGWDCEIVEMHRRGKRDAPSGTAKLLAAEATKRRSFCGATVHSLRCGDCPGTHTVIFACDGESLTLTHQALGIQIFAKGAIDEAELLLAAQNVPHGK